MNQLHDNIEQAIDLSKIINADEVGVIQLRHAFGFRFKGCPKLSIFAKMSREYFDCDGAIQRALARHVDSPHATLGNKGLYIVSWQ